MITYSINIEQGDKKMLVAQTANIERLYLLLTKGNRRQRETVSQMVAEEGLTLQDLETKSEKARATPDINLRAILFAVM